MTDITEWDDLNGNTWRTAFNPELTYFLSPKGELGQASIRSQFTNGYPTIVVIGKDYELTKISYFSVSEATIRKAISDMPDGNTAPTADAGSDQTVKENTTVTLDGSGSIDTDPGDSIVCYTWRQISGTTVSLSDSNSMSPTFTASETGSTGEELRFELTVEDSNGLTDTDTCAVTVEDTNTPPIADAGQDQTVDENVRVTLDGSASRDNDPGDSIVSYSWRQVSGTDVTLSDSTSSIPTFTTPFAGSQGDSLRFELSVVDSNGATATDSCIVNILYNTPVADAGADQTVTERDTVRFDGSDSSCYNPDDAVSTYEWVQKSGETVSLSNKNAHNPTFTAPNVSVNGATLVFELTINCNGREASDSISVTIENGVNLAPVAKVDVEPHASVEERVNVTLSAEQSTDPDGTDDIETYTWVQTSGPSVTLSCNDCIRPAFITPEIDTLAETLTFSLTVSDKENLSSKATCSVVVNNTDCAPPVATAGFAIENAEPDSAITANQKETLTLSSELTYDPDGTNDMVSYVWTQVEGPEVELSCTDCEEASFTTPSIDSPTKLLKFKLTVTDKTDFTSESTCTVQVIGEEDSWGCFIDTLF